MMAKTRVLLIDDEKLLVKSTVLALGCYEFDTDGALDGPEGLEKARKEPPDIILLDIMMPGMDGWQVLKQLKESDATRNIPVVIFTAKEYSNGHALAREQGAAGYVAKPFELEELVEEIRKHTS
ncbi:MAG: response regulator [Chitinivibrionales bacterium]|nr:response regulator [Chitinivibrionales bacterium]MBD3396706.1 response regulator [Chitinivibrionales bacterium]